MFKVVLKNSQISKCLGHLLDLIKTVGFNKKYGTSTDTRLLSTNGVFKSTKLILSFTIIQAPVPL